MDLTGGPQGHPQAAWGHHVVDADLEARREGVAPAEAALDAGEAEFQGFDRLADVSPLDFHARDAARQVAPLGRDEDHRHEPPPSFIQAPSEIAFQSAGGDMGSRHMRTPVALWMALAIVAG